VLSGRLKKIASYLEYSYNAIRELFVFLRFFMKKAFVMLARGVECSSMRAVHGSGSAGGTYISSAVRLVNWHVNVEGLATQFCKGFNKLCGLLRGDGIVEIVQKKT
jgi:hypothetical protein